jgi:hypothetical protein
LLSADFCNPLNHDFKDKHLWIKKATGLGVTEFFLRLMAWLCLSDRVLNEKIVQRSIIHSEIKSEKKSNFIVIVLVAGIIVTTLAIMITSSSSNRIFKS